MDFTAVGDTVNLSARLQGLATNSQILISDKTYAQVRDHINTRLVGEMHVKNRREAVMTYEVLDWS
jgi:adenylate cyclase